MTNLGILHPGSMGASIAASAQNSGYSVYWASEGRSTESRERAEQIKLEDAGTFKHLCGFCEIIVSVCPPDAAEALAYSVLEQGFKGIYLDANAISAPRAIRIGEALNAAGIAFVDGGIIGGPAWKAGTVLYLSGPEAQQAADWFHAGPLETSIVNAEIGSASALKMCFAAYTKGTTALLCGILATAESLGVREALMEQWSRDGSSFGTDAARRVQGVTDRAWRFAGEMDEISATFEGAGLPGGFHESAAILYRRIAHFKQDSPDLEAVLAALLEKELSS